MNSSILLKSTAPARAIAHNHAASARKIAGPLTKCARLHTAPLRATSPSAKSSRVKSTKIPSLSRVCDCQRSELVERDCELTYAFRNFTRRTSFPPRILTRPSVSTKMHPLPRSRKLTMDSQRNSIPTQIRILPPRTDSLIFNPPTKFYPIPRKRSNLTNSVLPASTPMVIPRVVILLVEQATPSMASAAAVRVALAAASTLTIYFPPLPAAKAVPLAAADDAAVGRTLFNRRFSSAKTLKYRPASHSWKPPRAQAKPSQSHQPSNAAPAQEAASRPGLSARLVKPATVQELGSILCRAVSRWLPLAAPAKAQARQSPRAPNARLVLAMV